LPEAQVDRFMLKIKITYPDIEEEKKILDRMSSGITLGQKFNIRKVVSPEDILRARQVVTEIYMDEKIKKYILDIVFSTRHPEKYKLEELKPSIAYGASPRATLYLAIASKCYAFLHNRGYVTPDDVKNIAMDVLRHRIILTYEAEAEELTSENIIKTILDTIEVP
ncbi:MAG: AAA family ATPase, partial [Endomicrobiia bacterium]